MVACEDLCGGISTINTCNDVGAMSNQCSTNLSLNLTLSRLKHEQVANMIPPRRLWTIAASARTTQPLASNTTVALFLPPSVSSWVFTRIAASRQAPRLTSRLLDPARAYHGLNVAFWTRRQFPQHPQHPLILLILPTQPPRLASASEQHWACFWYWDWSGWVSDTRGRRRTPGSSRSRT